MADIGFYHLTRTALGQALPQLLARTVAAGQRALVMCGTEDSVKALDKMLWQAPEPDWLPHGTEADGDPDLQPIWLTTAEAAPNGARFLFLVEGAETSRIGDFDRVFDLFDGNRDEQVAAARRRWTAAKAGGHSLSYWQQGPKGWAKKA
ncbi:MAG: DNA polymerase III subunit chi [Rhodospirillales bacterium]